jgi:para-aminobenzoate synthetase component 1
MLKKTNVRGAHCDCLEGAILGIASRVPNLAVFDLAPSAANGRTVLTWSDRPPIEDLNFLPAAREAIRGLPSGGLLAGYLGYEAGRSCERMPPPAGPSHLPPVHLRPTDGHLEHDARTGRWTAFGTSRFQREAHLLLSDAKAWAPPAPLPSPSPLTGPADRYVRAVQRVLEHVHDGEVYQVSLAWEAAAPSLPHPLEAWLQLRHDNPAQRGAFLSITPEHSVLSNSPETYLDVVRRGDRLVAESIPIKGTAALAEGPSGRAHLESSEKERAELTMIVDLVRNDLGRVAVVGTVEADARVLRVCGDLLHAEQRVRAQLKSGLDALAAVEASFPPGSVTGAPKVRAMEVIREQEVGPRGVYTGAIGFFDDQGGARLNVAIRTITNTPRGAFFHVGAGIVADSEPSAEWHETLAKGRRIHAMLTAMNTAHTSPGSEP